MSLIPKGPPLICLFDSSQPLPTFNVVSPQESGLRFWGCLSLPPVECLWFSALPCTIQDPDFWPLHQVWFLGLGHHGGVGRKSFFPGPTHRENFPTSLLLLNCLTKLFAGTSLQGPPKSLLPRSLWAHGHIQAHTPRHMDTCTGTLRHIHTGIFMHTFPWVQLPETAGGIVPPQGDPNPGPRWDTLVFFFCFPFSREPESGKDPLYQHLHLQRSAEQGKELLNLHNILAAAAVFLSLGDLSVLFSSPLLQGETVMVSGFCLRMEPRTLNLKANVCLLCSTFSEV